MRSEVNVYSLLARPFWDAYDDIKAGRHAEYWFKGGRGSTKSSCISLAILMGLLRDPQANALVYRRVANTLRDSVYSQFLWAVDELGIAPWFVFRRSPLEIVYRPTGQRILFRGADDPLKSKSIKLSKGYFGYLWFEELSEFRGMEDVRTIKQSAFRGVSRAVTLYSYNPPKSASAWVNAEALAQRPDRLVHSSSYLDVPPVWLGSAFLDEAEALRAVNERAWRNEYLGEVTGAGGQVFEHITLREIADEEIKTFGATYCGLDFGYFPDPAHFARCAYDPARRRLFIFGELRAIKTRNEDLLRLLRERMGLQAAEEVIADSAEPKSIADLRSYGMRCIGATKGPGSVRASMRWLQGLVEIVIDPVRCPETAREFTQYEYEKSVGGAYVDSYPDVDNHSIDAVRYALNRIWLQAGE